MPAPQRKPKQMVSIANDAIYAKEEEEIPFKPVIVRAPGHTNGDSLERFTEITMFGVAMLFIWGGLFGIAFAPNAGEEKFAYLFGGGLLSATIALFMVELQAKKNDYQLMVSQNYLLGMSFFFMAVGTLWGIRYVAGYLTLSEFEFDGSTFTLLGSVDGATGDFVASANLIYAQSLGAFGMWLSHRKILERYKGDTSFGWAVASYIPLGLLLVGVGTWIEWAEYEVSYPLGTAIVGLCGLAMYSALMSNKSINFAVVSVVSGVIPIIYELLNENAPAGGEGGALSLLIFIIIIQGFLAGNERLKQTLAEKMSFFMIGVVVMAMLISSLENFNLVIGPFKPAEIGNRDAATLITLPVALWITVLCAYFPATHRNRVPAMPIGLAFSLWTLDGDEAIIPWVIALVMISYMLFAAEATRKWVANFTMSALSFSYLFSDRIGYGVDQVEMDIAIAISIVVIAETARRLEKISIWNSVQTVTFIALSTTILDSEYWFVTWIFVIYLLGMVYESMIRARGKDDIERRNSTLALITALAVSTGLLLTGKLDIPEAYQISALNGVSLEFVLLGLIVYGLFNTVRDVEVDIGQLMSLLELKAAGAYTYDSETNAWYIKEVDDADVFTESSIGSIGRISMAFSLLAVTIGISMLNPEVLVGDAFYLVGLYAIPIGIVMLEIKSMDVISSQSRMIGAFMLLIVAASSIPLMFNVEHTDGLFKAGIMYDVIFLSAPIGAFALINKRGLDRDHLSRPADQVMLCVLLFIGMFDQSGGLLFLSMYGLVTITAIQYRHHGVTLLAPLATISVYWTYDHGLAHAFLDSFFDNSDDITEIRILWFTRVTGMLVAAHMLMPLAWSVRDAQSKEIVDNPFPWFLPMIWFLFAIWAVLPSASWLPLVACIFGIANAWVRGDINLIPLLAVGIIFSFMIGFADGGYFTGDIFGYSMLFSGAIIYVLWLAEAYGIMRMNVLDEERLEALMPYSLDTQLRFLAIATLLLSFDVANGLGMLAGSGWATYEAVQKGDKVSILFLPLIDGLTAANLIHQFEVGSDSLRQFLIGGIFFVEGAVMVYLSSKTDRIYDSKIFTWKDDDEFFRFIEYMGFSGVVAALTGIIYAFGQDQTEIAFFLTAAILTALAITGFDETQAQVRWRRGLGVFGSVLTMFSLYIYLDGSGDVLFRSLTLVLTGLLALGYGFMYMQRRSMFDVQDVVIPQVFGNTVAPQQPILETVVDDQDDDEDEIEEDGEEENHDIQEHEIKTETTSVEEEDSTDAEEMELLKLGEILEDELDEITKPIGNATTNNIGYIETMEGFDVRLPKESIEQITRTIAMTPHEGFKPVVRVNMLGQIVLDFEPL
tara:strand:+ start:9283 stop:13305 length:4023 start_codon:yes stop_codon:yes gene_type:complete